MVFVHTFLLSIIDLAKITSMNTWILRWREPVPGNGAKHFPYTTWPLNRGSLQMNSSSEMSIREWKMFPCDLRIEDVILWHFISNLATINLRILNIFKLQKMEHRRSWGGESDFLRAWMRSREKIRIESVFTHLARFYPENKLMLMSNERLTHAFRCIIWFFSPNNLARVNRLGTLCMAGILEQSN